jgi:hypothetical protein
VLAGESSDRVTLAFGLRGVPAGLAGDRSQLRDLVEGFVG